MSLIGVVKEQPGESRVAATPETVKVIISLGYQVVVEKGAGAKAAFEEDRLLRAARMLERALETRTSAHAPAIHA